MTFTRCAIIPALLLAAGSSLFGAVLPSADRVSIAAQRAAGAEKLFLSLAAFPGKGPSVANAITALHGTVHSRDDTIGYLYVSIPLVALDKVLAIPEIEALQADAGFLVQYAEATNSAPHLPESAPRAVPLPLPPDNPYTGFKATEVLVWREAHPNYDGRGVVIGAIELADLGAPSLAYGRELSGHLQPKVIEYRIASVGGQLPAEFKPAPTIAVQADAKDMIGVGENSYTVPPELRSDELRFLEHRSGRGGKGARYHLLWAVRSRSIRILVGEERDFGRGVAIILSGVAEPWGWAILNGALDSNRPAIAVTANEKERALSIASSFSSHGTMCASVAAGHDFGLIAAGGVAPGARLAIQADFVGGSSPSAFEAIQELLHDPRVDLLTISSGILDPTGSGNSLFGLLLHRALASNPKLAFRAWGNGGMKSEPPGIDQLEDLIAVGAYTPHASWRANFGIVPAEDHTPAGYTLHGPALDGGLKPDMLALSGMLCGAPGDRDHTGRFLQTPEMTKLSTGTSSAAPNAAGHAALLISAARQAGVPHDPARIRAALNSGCQFLEGVPAHVQGHGLIQVQRAWELLGKLKNEVPATFRTEAPVRHAWSASLTRPHIGRGLFEVGWRPGEKGTRVVTITRTSGATESLPYRLRWKGDTDTFSSSETTLSLPLNIPVSVDITVTAPAMGKTSAILDLVEDSRGVIAHSVMCTVVTAETLDQANGYRAAVTGRAPRPGNAAVYVQVPPGTSALRVQLRQKHGRVRLHVQGPDRRVDEDWGFAVTYSRKEVIDGTIPNPIPGVWQVWVDNSAFDSLEYYDPELPQPAPDCEFQLEIAALGVEARQSGGRVEFVSALRPPSNPHIESPVLGSAQEERFRLLPTLEGKWFEIDVPEGSTRLLVDLAPTESEHGDASLLLFGDRKNPADGLALAAYRRTGGLTKRIYLRDPKPGHYKLCVDPWGVAPAGVAVRTCIAVFHPKHGRATISDLSVTGSTYTARISAPVDEGTARGQTLVAAVELMSDESTAHRFLGLHDRVPPEAQADGTAKWIFKSVPLATAVVPLLTPD